MNTSRYRQKRAFTNSNINGDIDEPVERALPLRENVNLGYLHHNEEEPALPFDLLNLVGNYSGGACDALTDQGNRCVNSFSNEYTSEEFGQVRCAQYCLDSWHQWLLPILSTTLNDDTWVQVGERKGKKPETYDVEAQYVFDVQLAKWLSFYYGIQFAVRTPSGIQWDLLIHYQSRPVHLQEVDRYIRAKRPKYRLRMEFTFLPLYIEGDDEYVEPTEHDNTYIDAFTNVINQSWDAFADRLDQAEQSGEANILVDLIEDNDYDTVRIFAYYSDSVTEQQMKQMVSEFYTSLIESLQSIIRSYNPTNNNYNNEMKDQHEEQKREQAQGSDLTVNLSIECPLALTNLAGSFEKVNDPDVMLIYKLQPTSIDQYFQLAAQGETLQPSAEIDQLFNTYGIQLQKYQTKDTHPQFVVPVHWSKKYSLI